jgi:hypothetical protein
LASGDFNGDGIIDLAVTNINPSRYDGVKILLGKEDETFQAPVTYRVGDFPFSVAVGDFNGDGILDLAVANNLDPHRASGSVSVLLGNGDGTFQPQVKYHVGRYPMAVAVGDLNGDGKPDLAVADGTGSAQKRGFVGVLLGNGDGTFQAPLKSPAGKSPAFLAVGDLNGDGRQDLVAFDECGITCYTFRVNALLGDGGGTFKLAWTSKGGVEPSAIGLGDFNGNGKLDLAVSDTGDRLSIRLGNGDGTFGKKVNYPVGRDPDSIAVADFDGDGNVDVAVANASSSDVSVLLGKGDGTFHPASSYPLTPVAGAIAMVAVDVNGDGKPDLVVTDHSNQVVSVLLNTGGK